LGEKKNKIKHS